jgi:GH15 family glucan-1,4-alpha-glucosidase
VSRSLLRAIVERVEGELVGSRGVVRYLADTYHACHGGPPEWTMGFGFLALAWEALGEADRAREYLTRLRATANDASEYPESWCRDPEHDRYFNSPLCWSHALDVIASTKLGDVRAGGVEGPARAVSGRT